MDNFRGKVAVITGGASGIGFALARAFAQEHMKIVLSDRDAKALEKAVADLKSAGTQVIGVPADVANRESVFALADCVQAHFGAAHILCNNAGVTVYGSVETLTHADWEWSISVNLWGVIHGIEAFLPRMLALGEPAHIVNTSSFAGIVPSLHLAPYNVAKAAVVALTESLHKDLRGTSVGASVLCPMRVATRIWESSRQARPKTFGGSTAYRVRPPEEAAQMVGEILDADYVATIVLDSIRKKRLFILPHDETRPIIRRRFEKIDAVFDSLEKNRG
jgi:NAD(P)-dependent dehydrogenase (short-subunit alcohol dehydrogenase family)